MANALPCCYFTDAAFTDGATPADPGQLDVGHGGEPLPAFGTIYEAGPFTAQQIQIGDGHSSIMHSANNSSQAAGSVTLFRRAAWVRRADDDNEYARMEAFVVAAAHVSQLDATLVDPIPLV